jgi:hypothetical protein
LAGAIQKNQKVPGHRRSPQIGIFAADGKSTLSQFLASLGDRGISGFTNFDNANSCVLGLMTAAKTTKSHAFLMDPILTEYADQAYETARLRRNGIRTARDWVSARY